MQYSVFLSSELCDELKCPVCSELLKDPVSIPCGHTYCRSCITEYQAKSKHRERACPKCGQIPGSGSVLLTNITVAALVEKIKPALRSLTDVTETEDVEPSLCQKHHIARDMFCKTDRAAICKECAVTGHRHHEKQYIRVRGGLVSLQLPLRDMLFFILHSAGFRSQPFPILGSRCSVTWVKGQPQSFGSSKEIWVTNTLNASIHCRLIAALKMSLKR